MPTTIGAHSENRPNLSKRLHPSWIVLESLENPQHDRCVDIVTRPDGSFGIEEFRPDPEDGGAWTPVAYFSTLRLASKNDALVEAARRVAWLPPQEGTLGYPSRFNRVGYRSWQEAVLDVSRGVLY